MPLKLSKISLIYLVLITLLVVGIVPLLITGWSLSERSAKELRAVEGRYQTQLVQDKARQIEMFGQRYGELISGIAGAFELSPDFSLLSSTQAQQKIGQTLKENPYLLSIYIKPIQGEPLSVFRSEMIKEPEVERIASELLAHLSDKKVFWGSPQILPTSNENVITAAVPVLQSGNITAAVVAVISLQEISRIMAEAKSSNEKELWEAGLPIIFVVDEKGQAVFHPDPQIISAKKFLGNIKIVEEWKEANRQIQSALVPFTAEFEDARMK